MPSRTNFIIIIFSLAMIAALSYSYFVQRMLSQHYFPLNQFTLNLQFHITTSHLWFEEMISGDRQIAVESVWKYIDKAERYAKMAWVDIYNDIDKELGRDGLLFKMRPTANKICENILRIAGILVPKHTGQNHIN